MAGEFPGGGADRFRAGVRFAMEMGQPPPEEGEEIRVAFLFAPQLVYGTPTDANNVPFGASPPVTEVRPPAKVVPCAAQAFDAAGQLLEFGGVVSPTRVEITLLDEDYLQVKDAIAIVIHGDRYDYRKTMPPSGLFSVGLYTLHFYSVNEV